MLKGILIIILIILAGLSFYMLYNLYLDNFSNSENLRLFKPIINTSQPSYESELQFYSNMRFNHNELSYKIGSECSEEKINNMKSAFSFLRNKTSLIFLENEKADINISCGEQYSKEDLFVAGDGGPSSFVDTGVSNVILQGKIILFYKESCGDNIELHELLHVFGFKHSDNPNSIMYNITKCNQVVTDDIINEINKLYSQKALPDLFFENISAVKHGRYLDINFTIKNQGLINADKILVEVDADNEKVKDLDFGEIEFGAAKLANIKNIELQSRNIDKIEVYIDKGNVINELNKDNNKAELVLSES